MNIKTKLGYAACGFVFALLAPNVVFAQDNTKPLDGLFACADIESDNERWRCYDTQVPLLREKEQRQEIVTIDSEKVKEIERDAFGFSLPKLNILRSNKKDKDDKKDQKAEKIEKEVNNREQVFDISSIDRRRSGLKITMDNGQVWEQVNGSTGSVSKRTRQARIKPATFGSYLMTLLDENGKTTRRGIRVRRIK
ncbi:MAG: hypothetical protein ABJ275_08965 [Maricaulaceae bacterium]